MKVLINDQETHRIKGKNKSDHNTFIIDIFKIHPKYSWNINNNTNWNTYKNAMKIKQKQAIIKIQNRQYTVQQ